MTEEVLTMVYEAISSIEKNKEARNIYPAVALTTEIAKATKLAPLEIVEAGKALQDVGLITFGQTINQHYYRTITEE